MFNIMWHGKSISNQISYWWHKTLMMLLSNIWFGIWYHFKSEFTILYNTYFPNYDIVGKSIISKDVQFHVTWKHQYQIKYHIDDIKLWWCYWVTFDLAYDMISYHNFRSLARLCYKRFDMNLGYQNLPLIISYVWYSNNDNTCDMV